MLSRGKKYEKGRIVYAIFVHSRPTPFLYVKISRDPSFDFTLEKEYASLARLRNIDDPIINRSIPLALRLARIQDRLVLVESALPGRTMLGFIDSRPAGVKTDVRLYTKKFINLVEEWLRHFQSVTKRGTEIITKPFLDQWIRPILQRYLECVGCSDDSRKRCSILLSELESFEGTILPVVTINGNLAPNTVLVDDELSWIGIVDWRFCETTPLVLREHYCFAQYLFYEWFHRGFLQTGDIEDQWVRTFVNTDNLLGKPIKVFIERVNERLGIAPGLGNVLLPLFLVNEVNLQVEYSKFVPDPRALCEGA